MVDILDKLKNKPDPLRKKANIPASVPLAEAGGATPNQAQMTPTPQFQQAQLRRQGQQAQRSAQVKAEAPREMGTEEQTSFDRAQQSINAKAAFNQADFGAAQSWQMGQGEEIDPVTGLPTGQDLAAGIADGTITEEGIRQAADQASEDFLYGTGFEDSLTMTLGELRTYIGEGGPAQNDPAFTEIIEYATQVLKLDDSATLSEIKQAVDTEVQQATAIVDNQREIINDPNATPMERQSAMRTMKDYGAAHLIATDAELDEFVNDISTLGVMEIDGQQVTLEDLQDNEAVMSMMALAADNILEDPDHVPDWAEDHPDLWGVVQKNATAIASSMSDDIEKYQTTKETVDNNKIVTDAMGPKLTKTLGLDVPSGTDIKETYPGVVIFGVNAATEFPELDIDAAKEALEYLAINDSEQLKQLMQDPNLADKMSGVITRTKLLSSIDKSTGYMSLAAALKLDFNNIKEFLKDVKAHPDNYDPQMKEFLEAFRKGKDAIKELVSDSNFFMPEFGKTHSQKVTEHARELIKETGLDFKNIIDNPQYKFNQNNSKNALRKVNTLLDKLKGPAKDNPQVAYYVQKLDKIRKELVRYSNRKAGEGTKVGGIYSPEETSGAGIQGTAAISLEKEKEKDQPVYEGTLITR